MYVGRSAGKEGADLRQHLRTGDGKNVRPSSRLEHALRRLIPPSGAQHDPHHREHHRNLNEHTDNRR